MPSLADYKATIVELGLLIRITEDAEAFTYAKKSDSTTVVRLFKNASLIKFEELKQRKKFSDALRVRDLPFNVENITVIHCGKGLLYTEQVRTNGVIIAGQNKKTVALDTKLYFETIQQISALDILPSMPIITDWAKFIAKKTRELLSKNSALLQQHSIVINPTDVEAIQKAITDRLAVVPKLGFIHGKLTPDNLLIDQLASAKPCTVLDFGTNSMIGDTRFDLAAGLFFLESLEPSTKKSAARVFTNLLRTNFDAKFYTIINIYRIYFALRYLIDPAYQAAAIITMKNWQQVIAANYFWQPLTVDLPALALFKQKESVATDDKLPLAGEAISPRSPDDKSPRSPLSGISPTIRRANRSTSSGIGGLDINTIKEMGVGEDGEIDHGNEDDQESPKHRLIT